MRAKVAFGQADGFHHTIQSIEFQCIHSDMLAQHLHKVGIFRCRRVAVFLDVLVVVAFHFLDAASRDEFHDGLGSGEVEELTSIEQGRTADADVYFFCAEVVEHSMRLLR